MTRDEALDVLKRNYPSRCFEDLCKAVDIAIKALSAQSEIIRCKDCKHRDAKKGFCEGRGWPMQLVPDDGFCDKGERSGDDK